MDRIALLPLVALPMAGAIALVTPACGDACEDLAPVCERCTDANTRASCEQTVEENVQDICSGRQAIFEPDCPEVVTTASSTGVVTSNASATSASSAASSASAGGSGGTAAGGAGGQGGN